MSAIQVSPIRGNHCSKCHNECDASTLKKHWGMCTTCRRVKTICPTCQKPCSLEILAKYRTMCSKCFHKKDLFCGKCSSKIKTGKSQCYLEYKGLCEKCHWEEWLNSDERKKEMDNLGNILRENYILKHLPRQTPPQPQPELPPPRETKTFQFSRLQQKDCPICLSPFKETEDIKMLPCLHYYHSSCYDELINRNPDAPCPTCRQ